MDPSVSYAVCKQSFYKLASRLKHIPFLTCMYSMCVCASFFRQPNFKNACIIKIRLFESRKEVKGFLSSFVRNELLQASIRRGADGYATCMAGKNVNGKTSEGLLIFTKVFVTKKK
jgi:hypothetical protein